MSGESVTQTWILCETRRRYHSLSRSQPADSKIYTILDGCIAMVQRMWPLVHSGPAPRFVKEVETALLLATVARESGWLTEEPSHIAAPQLPWQLKSLIDSVRLHEATDSLIRNAIDELGNPIEGGLRVERIVGVVDAWSEFQREYAVYDAVGVYETLLDLLQRQGEVRELIKAQLPKRIVLDFPQTLYPLTDRLWRALSLLVDVSLTSEVAALENDSQRILTPRFRLAEKRLDAPGQCRIEVLKPSQSTQVDGQNVTIVRAAEEFDETDFVAREISKLLADGVAPGSVHVVAMNLDRYQLLLTHALNEAGVPFAVSRGVSLKQGMIASRWKSFRLWIEEQTIEAWAGFFGHPASALSLKRGEGAAGELEELLQLPILADVLKSCSPESLLCNYRPSAARLIAAARAVGVERKPNCDLATISELLGLAVARASDGPVEQPAKQVDSANFHVIIDASLYLRDLGQASRVAQQLNTASGLRSAWRLFRRCSKKSREILAQQGDLKQADAAARALVAQHLQATRALARLVRQVNKLLAFQTSSAGFVAPAVLLQELIDRQVLAAKSVDSAVYVSELLDLRGEFPDYVFILGATAQALQERISQTTLLPPEDAVRQKLADTWMRERGYDELMWLWNRAVRYSRRTYFLYPESDNRGVTQPAGFVVELARQVGITSANSVSLNRASVNRASGSRERGRVEPPPDAMKRRLNLLRARHSNELTEFDGLIGNAAAAAKRAYSVTALEMLHDCPHRYFFRYQLRLKHLGRTPLEEIDLLVGKFTHQALQIFFEKPRWGKAAIATNNFAEACSDLLQIAQDLRSRSLFGITLSPIFEMAFEKIVRGLDCPERERFGLLKAALAICREHIKSVPVACEWRFGLPHDGSSAGNLVLCGLSPSESSSEANYETGSIVLSGVVDRLDAADSSAVVDMSKAAGFPVAPGAPVASGQFSVWDYKTGQTVGKFARELQVPLYAEAISRLMPSASPTTGGYLLLGAAMSTAESAKWINTVLTAEGEERTRALAVVRELDQLVLNGRFHQRLETESCARCEFASICARDLSVLTKKLSSEEAENNSNEIIGNPPTELTTTTPAVGHVALLQLSSEQQAAADISQSVALEAGAGSGKTAVLRSRIIRLILSGIGVERILAITFTEKAAEEIRARVEIAIHDALAVGQWERKSLTPDQLGFLRAALRKLPSAFFTTIHALCAKLAMAAGIIPADRRVLSAAEAGQFVDSIIQQTFHDRNYAAGERSGILRLARAGIGTWVIERELRRLVRRPDRLAELKTSVTSTDPRQALDLVRRLAEICEHNYRAGLAEELNVWWQGSDTWRSEFLSSESTPAEKRELLLKLVDLHADLQVQLAENGTWRESLQQLNRLLSGEISRKFRKSASMPINYPKLLRERIELLGSIPVRFNAERECQAWELSQLFIECASGLRERYEQDKRSKGVIDFDDFIAGAWESLQTPTQKAATFDHLLVDEFQDTDERQWEIVRRLVGSLEQRTLFIVGDSKQAIYGFRGGDVITFQRAKQWIAERGGKVLSLADNYRTAPGVLEVVNPLFDRLLNSDFDSSGAAIHEAAVRPQAMNAKRATHGGASILTVESDRNGWGSKQPEAQSVAAFVAARLRTAAHAKGSIALIARTQSQLGALASALEANGVAFTTTHGDGFFELPEVRQFQLLFESLFFTNQISIVGVLRSALIGCSDLDLRDLGEACSWRWDEAIGSAPPSNTANQGANSANGLIHEVRQTWERMSFLAQLLTPAELVSQLIAEFRLTDLYQSLHDASAVANLWRLVVRILAAENSGRLQFGRDIVSWFETEASDPTHPPPTNDINSPVVVTTVHGAKGLEFPVVILPFLRGRRHESFDFLVERFGGSLLGLRMEDPDSRFKRVPTVLLEGLSFLARQRERSEELRVFYVACTRARDELIFCLPEGAETDAQSKDLLNSLMPSDWLNEFLKYDRTAPALLQRAP